MPATDSSPTHLLPALRTDAWFGTCDDVLQQALSQRSQLVRLAAGERLFGRGDAADGLCCVVAGSLRAGVLRPDGSQTRRGAAALPRDRNSSTPRRWPA